MLVQFGKNTLLKSQINKGLKIDRLWRGIKAQNNNISNTVNVNKTASVLIFTYHKQANVWKIPLKTRPQLRRQRETKSVKAWLV